MSRGMEKNSRTQKRAKIFPPACAGGIFYGKVRLKRRCPRCSAGKRALADLPLRPSGWKRPPSLSLRGSAGAVAISQYPAEHGKASGELATVFPRLPRRACALLAMTREEGTPKFVIARLRRSRGNLAGCSRNTGKPPANSQVRSRDRRPRRFIFPAAKNQGQAIGLPLCFVLLQLRVAHEDGRELCAGGIAGRLEAAVLAVDDARADAPAQRVNSP